MGDEIIKIIGYITERLGSMGPQAEQAFRILVEYQRVQGFVFLVTFLASSMVGAISLWLAVKIRKDWERHDAIERFFDATGHSMAIAGLLVVVVFCVWASVTYLSGAITHIMIPEYFAIQELLSTVKPR
jgi:hypothetical protein